MDALQFRDPVIDEFILLSSDSDFTPVLSRIRQHARRIVVVAADQSAQAYRSMADEVIGVGEFISEALSYRQRMAGVLAPDADAVDPTIPELNLPGPSLPASSRTAEREVGRRSLHPATRVKEVFEPDPEDNGVDAHPQLPAVDVFRKAAGFKFRAGLSWASNWPRVSVTSLATRTGSGTAPSRT